MNRREFARWSLKAAGVAAAATASPSLFYTAPVSIPIGLELYTVRHDLERDFDGTLAKVAAIGYREVELYGLLGKTPQEIRKSLSAAGLECQAGHTRARALAADFRKEVATAKELGLRYLVCALDEPVRPSALAPPPKSSGNAFRHGLGDMNARDYEDLAELYNRVGSACRDAGIVFGFHAHNYEFRDVGGRTGFDTLVQYTDPKRVCVELDCYWVARAGRDPVDSIRKLAGRVPLLHIKDMKAGHAPTTDLAAGGDAFAEVGRGSIDWKAVFRAAEASGVQRAFVEQDQCEGPPLQSARMSFEYLKTLQL